MCHPAVLAMPWWRPDTLADALGAAERLGQATTPGCSRHAGPAARPGHSAEEGGGQGTDSQLRAAKGWDELANRY
ncbi:hypothetical protein GCM10009584_14430 [Ornithinimicrobium humiphilum]